MRSAPPAVAALARGVFALLVVASFAAFLLTQRLKHTPTVVQKLKYEPHFSPSVGSHHKLERISFRIAHADLVTVTIIDPAGEDVATLVRDYRLSAYRKLSLRWNGRRVYMPPRITQTSTGLKGNAANRGPLAAAGEYRIRIHLAHANKTVLSTSSFSLIRTAAAPRAAAARGEQPR